MESFKFVSTALTLFLLIFLIECKLVYGCDIFRKINVNLYDEPLNVEKIDVENVQISNLCRNAIRNLENLYTIQLIGNQMSGIESGAFNNLPSLRNLIIKENKIKSIDDGVFNNLQMRKLDLSSNKINKIGEKAFADMPNLEVLILDMNKIKTIHSEWFKNTPKLYRLSMMDNSLNIIQEHAFQHLNGNARPRDLDIWLSKNVLREINAQAFDNIDKIDTLWLDDNQLDENIFDAISQIKIQNLHLKGNKLKCIDDKILKKLKINELVIDDNPLDCKCLKTMRKISKSQQIHLNALKTGLQCLRSRIKDLGVV